MKNLIIKLLTVVLFIGTGIPVFSQYTFFSPEGSFAIETSLENTDLQRLPIYRNAITSLSVVGGTSTNDGLSPFVFAASLEKREMVNILDVNGLIKGQQSVKSGFVRNKQGRLFAETIAQATDNIGGHIVKIGINSKGKIKLEDLGIPVAGEGVCAITSDLSFITLYGTKRNPLILY